MHDIRQHLLVKRLSFFVLMLASLNGCTANDPAPIAPSRAPVTLWDEAAGTQIDQFIASEMKERHIAGLAAAVISNGEVRYAKGYGFADLERGVPVRPDTPFLIASVTKMFTAVATMQLIHEGKVQLDAPVGEYVHDLPGHWRPATVRQLLGHTAGLSSFSSHDTPPCGRRAEEKDYKQQDLIFEVSCLPLEFPPGTSWSYSDTGYFVLGMLIERVSGLTYEQYLRRKILEPLGMNDTRLMGPMGVDDGRAVGYRWDRHKHMRGPSLSPVIEGPSGGLVSTVLDLAKFDAALSDDRLLPQQALRTMWQPLGVGTAMYGLGFAVRPIAGRRQVGHTGGGPAAATSFARFIDDDLTVVVLTNTAQPPLSIQEIVRGIAERARRVGIKGAAKPAP